MRRNLTTKEVAELLQVDPDTVRRWKRLKLIEPVPAGPKLVRYDIEEVVAAFGRMRGVQQGDLPAQPNKE